MRLHFDNLVGMEQIGIATLRPKLTSTLKRVEAGETIVAVNHEHPRAVLVPPSRYQAMQDIIRSVDSEFLSWIYDRLVEVHGENPNVDYMRKLKSISSSVPS